MIIREKQFEALAEGVRHNWFREFATRLRMDFPDDVSQMKNEQLLQLVEQGCANAEELEIMEKEDMYRFLKLRFLPKESLESPFLQSIIIRVLNNLDAPGAKRLDFLEKHVANRKLTGQEPKP